MKWAGPKLLAVAAAALVLTAGAQAEKQLIRTTFLTQPAWSPDGTHVAWVAGPANGYGTVWVADASGRNARPLHQFGHSPLDGVDGVGQIAWETPRSLLVDAQLSGVVQLFRLNLRGQATVLNQLSDLNFSTDASRRLVATTGYTSSCGHPNCPAPIHVLDTATRNVTAVGRPWELDMNPALAPDGRHVAYDRAACPATNCGNAQGIWLAAWRNGTRRQIVRDGAYPVWSPNGEQIAYVEAGSVWTCDRDGRNRKKQYVPEGSLNYVADIAWSPGSDQLAISVIGSVTDPHVELLRIADGHRSRVRESQGRTVQPGAHLVWLP